MMRQVKPLAILVLSLLAGQGDVLAQDAKLIEAAKKEGQVVVYIIGYDAILQDFEKEFPEIKVTAVTGRGNQLGPRLLHSPQLWQIDWTNGLPPKGLITVS